MCALRLSVAVGLFGNDRRRFEIIGGRRRWRLPFQAFRAPGIRSGYGSIADGPEKIDEWNQVAYAEYGRRRRRTSRRAPGTPRDKPRSGAAFPNSPTCIAEEINPAYTDWLDTNRWWPQTRKLNTAIARLE